MVAPISLAMGGGSPIQATLLNVIDISPIQNTLLHIVDIHQESQNTKSCITKKVILSKFL